jgi:DNA-binding transcriptional regulator YiaG
VGHQGPVSKRRETGQGADARGRVPIISPVLLIILLILHNLVIDTKDTRIRGACQKKITLSLDNIGETPIINGMKGHDLTEWRKRWGLTQIKLAQALGVDVMTVSRWERGVQVPTPVLPLALEALEHRMTKGGNDGFTG